jgi:SAM-dependent methyltransferase
MDPLDQFKAAQKAGWVHFAPLQAATTVPAAQLVRHAGIRSGMRVLDVACGTGVVAVTAAIKGAHVTGLDLTPELLAAAKQNAATAGVVIDFHEGDVEQLPFGDATYDAVVSQFGHMFAPRPDVAVREMLRVLKPGGVLAFSTWPPELLLGRLFALTARYAPPPPVPISPPPLWGDPAFVRDRLGDAVSDIVFDRAIASFPALSIQHQRETTERAGGPMVKLVESLATADPQKLAAFRQEHESLIAQYFENNAVHQGFLMTRAIKR